MTNEAYELLSEILAKRADYYADKNSDMAWVYGNVREMIRLAQLDKTECLQQYNY